MPLKIIDNFTGRLTRNNIGDMNSGMAKYSTTYGNNPFATPERLTWFEQPLLVDTMFTTITGVIVAAKARLESGITYVYAVDHKRRVYKIQVNSPSTHNANYDNPVLLTTLSVNCNGLGLPSFKYGGSMQFFGNTAQIYIGHDHGVTRLNFDGTGEAYIIGSNNTDNVPSPLAVFGQYLYVGSGPELVQINGTPTVINGGILNPAFPTGSYVRSIDVVPAGNYLEIIVSKILPADITVSTQDTASLAATDSTKYLWNGVDPTYNSFENYYGFGLTANETFGAYSYWFGNDLNGTAVYTDKSKILSLPSSLSPLPTGVFSTGNMVGFAAPDYTTANGKLTGAVSMFGQYDSEIPKGVFRLFRINASSQDNLTDTDIIQMPVCLTVSNLFYGNSNSGYANNLIGTAKIYFSTVEVNASTTHYKFYKFDMVPTGLGNAIGGVYETQQETSLKLFRSIVARKFKPTAVRFYTSSLVSGNSFKIDLIGSNLAPMNGGSQTFTVGTNVTAGADYVWFTPATEPTYSLGVRITNLGNVNWTGNKLEVDYEEGGY
jgi:hypothetical protein